MKASQYGYARRQSPNQKKLSATNEWTLAQNDSVNQSNDTMNQDLRTLKESIKQQSRVQNPFHDTNVSRKRIEDVDVTNSGNLNLQIISGTVNPNRINQYNANTYAKEMRDSSQSPNRSF